VWIRDVSTIVGAERVHADSSECGVTITISDPAKDPDREVDWQMRFALADVL